MSTKQIYSEEKSNSIAYDYLEKEIPNQIKEKELELHELKKLLYLVRTRSVRVDTTGKRIN